MNLPNLDVSEFASMEKSRDLLQITTINSDIFAIVDSVELYESLEKALTPVELYSDRTKTWQHQYVQIEERYYYSLCSFRKQLFVIGGVK